MQQSVVDIEHLQLIYNTGNYTECLEAVNLFLLFNSQNLEGLLLKAKCEYQLSYNNENSDDQVAIAINSFEEVLKLAPAHEEAMLYMAYINIFITGLNLPEAITYCDQLATSIHLDTRIKAITYRQEAYYQTGDIDHALKDLNLLIKLNHAHTTENRSWQTKSKDCCMRKK